MPGATYYRWQAREREGRLADEVVMPCRRAVPPTPQERQAVCSFALTHPQTGYKRLTWQMVDEDVACLRPYQVYGILSEQDLLCRQISPATETLRRPPEPDHPDQVWHIDLMYLYIPPRWYYLVDILDSYSRFLVHWRLNLTMLAETVTLTVQEAMERLPPGLPGEPRLVHDHGSQFLSREWHLFVEGVGLTDIKTRVAHPQSNGRLERLHRTHREEGLSQEELTDYHQALDVLTRWSHYYNTKRSHSSLKYLRPVDYYRGDPEARLVEREQKLGQAAEARQAYWLSHSSVKEQCDPHIIRAPFCLTSL
jgi:putative transposase